MFQKESGSKNDSDDKNVYTAAMLVTTLRCVVTLMLSLGRSAEEEEENSPSIAQGQTTLETRDVERVKALVKHETVKALKMVAKDNDMTNAIAMTSAKAITSDKAMINTMTTSKATTSAKAMTGARDTTRPPSYSQSNLFEKCIDNRNGLLRKYGQE